MSNLLEAFVVTGAFAGLAVATRLVRPGAIVGGLLVGVVIYAGFGRGGFAILFLFFAAGTAVTRIGYRRKAARGLAEPHGGRRGTAHALANGGPAACCALVAMLFAELRPLSQIAFAGTFASALADTAGSEIGQLAGRRTFSPLRFRAVPRGTDGAISLEGTLAGVLGAALVALTGGAVGLYGPLAIVAVALAGIAGTTLESIAGSLGVTRRMGHMALNASNALAGGVLAVAFHRWLA